jgi:DNA-3-methyladenine glycosylase I
MPAPKQRCSWTGDDPLMQRYHDTEWGVPVHRDRKLFEFLILEGAQAGLSWMTILRRREGYRRAFARFDWNAVAQFNESTVEELMQDTGIIRNRLKINGAITNARAFHDVRAEFGTFSKYIWGFVDGAPVQGHRETMADVPGATDLAVGISKDMKKRGFTFVGPTIMYAHMQATGLVNDHLQSCFRYQEVQRR